MGKRVGERYKREVARPSQLTLSAPTAVRKVWVAAAVAAAATTTDGSGSHLLREDSRSE